MKKDNNMFLKTRIIFSSIILGIILIGWSIYGINLAYSNPNMILKKMINDEYQTITKEIDKWNIKDPINLELKENIYLYLNPSNNEYYLYNKEIYFDITNYLKVNNITLNNKETTNKENYKSLLKSINSVILDNYKLLEKSNKKDNDKKKYQFIYTINNLAPIITSLKTNKDFINTINKLTNLSTKEINNKLDELNNNNFGISILTEGLKKDITSYSIRIDNFITFNKNKKYISGFFLDYSYIYQDDTLSINDEYNTYNINQIDNKFKKDNLSEGKWDNILKDH